MPTQPLSGIPGTKIAENVSLGRVEGRLRAELAASGERHPRIRVAWRWFIRHRLWFIVGAALVVGLLDGRGHFEVQDPQLFIGAGKKLLSLHPFDAFADKTVQEGPLALMFWGLTGYVADLINVDARMVASLVINVGGTLAIVFTVRRALEERDRPSADLELFATAIVLLGGLTWTMLSTGHIAEGLIPLLWLHAARDARHGRVERAGLLIGVSAGLKLWGVLGVPLLLLGPPFEWRRVLRGAAALGGVLVLLYAPFVLFGTFNAFDYRWEIADSSLIHKLFPDSTAFTWQMRALQSAVVVGFGAGLALFARRRAFVDWAIPAAVIGLKLLLDPIVFSYYSLSVAVIALIAAVALLSQWPPWLRVVAAAGLYAALYPSWLLDGNLAGLVALLAALVAASLGPARIRSCPN